MFQTILAKDCKIGETYLLVLAPSSIYKIVIKSINIGFDNVISSVGINDERYPSKLINISGDSPLVEWDEQLYNNSKKQRSEKREEIKISNSNNFVKKVNKSQEVKSMSQNKNPRSKVIDELLAQVVDGTTPNFQEIALKVIKEVNGSEEDLKKVTSQIRVRHWTFTKGGKKNPFKT